MKNIFVTLLFIFALSSLSFADCVLSSPCPAVQNTTSVTAAAASGAAQNLMQLVEIPGMLNYANRTILLTGSGTTITGASANGALTWTLNLCTVSGCGSGTVVAIATIGPTASEVASLTTGGGWFCEIHATTVVTGASGTLQAGGFCSAEILSTTNTAIASTYVAPISAASSAIDLTKQLFWQWQITAAGSSANNSNKQLYADRIVAGP